MSMSIQTPPNVRSGMCPHGLPPAACPICKDGGGMGGSKMRDMAATKPAKPSGEWSYMKCYAVGLAMKANEARAENIRTAFEREIEFAKQFRQNIQNIADRMQKFIQDIKNSSPLFLRNSLQVLNRFVIQPLFNFVLQIPKIIEKFAEFQQKAAYFLLQAGEKLTAILGDIKNFISAKLVNNVKKQIKKLLFPLFSEDGDDDEYSRTDDLLKVFKPREIQKYIAKILKVKKERKDNADRSLKESKTI